MQFQKVLLGDAEGHVLGHNITGDGGRRVLRKGRRLEREDLSLLQELDLTEVWVARLEPGDIGEDEAAEQIAAAVAGGGLRRSVARTGRVNLYAEELGLLRVDLERLERLNGLEGIALSTLEPHTVARAGKMVATLKVISYALPGSIVAAAAEVATRCLHITALEEKRVGLIIAGSQGAQDRLLHSFLDSLRPRLEGWGSRLDDRDVAYVAGGAEQRISVAIRRLMDDGLDLLILAGETAIMDRQDVPPRAIELAGGAIAIFGAPVDPGNLLVVAYRQGVPIVGAPGCARSPKRNVVDLVLPRLLAGDRLRQEDVLGWGAGGLLEDVPERRLPRKWIG